MKYSTPNSKFGMDLRSKLLTTITLICPRLQKNQRGLFSKAHQCLVYQHGAQKILKLSILLFVNLLKQILAAQKMTMKQLQIMQERLPMTSMETNVLLGAKQIPQLHGHIITAEMLTKKLILIAICFKGENTSAKMGDVFPKTRFVMESKTALREMMKMSAV